MASERGLHPAQAVRRALHPFVPEDLGSSSSLPGTPEWGEQQRPPARRGTDPAAVPVLVPLVFDPPFTASEAWDALSRVLESPSLTILMPGPHFWALLAKAIREGDTIGNGASEIRRIVVDSPRRQTYASNACLRQ